MKANRLVGHGLRMEGRVQLAGRLIGDGNGEGRGSCTCGVDSPLLPSTAARKRWHREHKDAIRGKAS